MTFFRWLGRFSGQGDGDIVLRVLSRSVGDKTLVMVRYHTFRAGEWDRQAKLVSYDGGNHVSRDDDLNRMKLRRRNLVFELFHGQSSIGVKWTR